MSYSEVSFHELTYYVDYMMLCVCYITEGPSVGRWSNIEDHLRYQYG